MKSRTALRTGGSRIDSARNIRLGSATMFALGDPAGPLFNASRLNPANFINKPVAKPLFQFLYYHDGDVRKALDLCKTIVDRRQGEGEVLTIWSIIFGVNISLVWFNSVLVVAHSNRPLLHRTRKSTKCRKISTWFVAKMCTYRYGTVIGSCLCKDWSAAGSDRHPWEFAEEIPRWGVTHDTSSANIGIDGQSSNLSANASAHCRKRGKATSQLFTLNCQWIILIFIYFIANQCWSTFLYRGSSFLWQSTWNGLIVLPVSRFSCCLLLLRRANNYRWKKLTQKYDCIWLDTTGESFQWALTAANSSAT